MSQQIPIEIQKFDKNQFGRVIDTQFKQLINSQQDEITPEFSLDDFFELYDNLFYQIPREGEIDSHRFILEKEAEYLGVVTNQDDVQALLDEITSLRQQVLDLQTTVSELSKVVR
jgi:hypothetical protein